MRTANERSTLIGSVQRALRLLEAASGHTNGAPAKQLARETGLALGTTYHLLRTLVHDGYLRRLDDGAYVLGDRVGALYQNGRDQATITRVRPALAALRDDLNAAAYLAFFSEGEIRVTELVDGPRAPRVDIWVGFSDAAHATALGKCILGTLAEAARRDYLSRHPLYDLTPNTITDPVELMRRVAEDRSTGLVLDREEYALGTICAAVPVTDGKRIGSLGISVPASRKPGIEATADRLIATATRITRTLTLAN